MDQSRSFAELMKEFRRKVKIYHRDQNKRESKTSDHTGVMPLNQDENPVNNNQEAYWAQREAYWDQQFSRITVTEECLPESIGEVVGQIIGEDDGLEEMIESQLRSYPAIVLKKCSDERCVQLGEYFCKHLNCGMSQMAVGSILFVAYQLKEPGIGFGGRLFPAKDALSSGIEVDLEALDVDIYTVVGGKTEVGMKTKDVRELSRAYAFLACSMLRMFSKPPENYRMSWRHILDGYRKFYMTEFPLIIQEPSLEVLTQIYDSFKLTRLFRHTLYRFLYNANEKEMVTPLQSYLYDMHLSFTGMHIFPISCKICTSLRVCPRDLLVTMYCRGYEPQIRALAKVFMMMINMDKDHRRLIWKYGRIFDPRYLRALQTKACPKLCFILACVLRRVMPEGNDNILQIKQFEDVDQEDKIKFKVGAKLIVAALSALAK